MDSVEWKTTDELVDYASAVSAMEARVAAIRAGAARELAWLVEHPPLYTRGTSADTSELVEPARFPVHETGRGGRYTYHGPGQRVAYVMLNLRGTGRQPDLRRFVRDLEDWLIDTVADFGITAFRRDGRIGVWVEHPEPWRGQDRRAWGAGTPLGDLSRRLAQHRTRSRALRRHRAVRHSGLRGNVAGSISACRSPWPRWMRACGSISRPGSARR